MPIRVLEIGKKNFQRPYTDNREIWTQVRLDPKTHVLMPMGEQTNRTVEGITKTSKVKTFNSETGRFQGNAKGDWPRSDTSFLTYNAGRQNPEGEDGNDQDVDMSNQSMTISPSELPPLLSQESEEQEIEESDDDGQQNVKPEEGEESSEDDFNEAAYFKIPLTRKRERTPDEFEWRNSEAPDAKLKARIFSIFYMDNEAKAALNRAQKEVFDRQLDIIKRIRATPDEFIIAYKDHAFDHKDALIKKAIQEATGFKVEIIYLMMAMKTFGQLRDTSPKYYTMGAIRVGAKNVEILVKKGVAYLGADMAIFRKATIDDREGINSYYMLDRVDPTADLDDLRQSIITQNRQNKIE